MRAHYLHGTNICLQVMPYRLSAKESVLPIHVTRLICARQSNVFSVHDRAFLVSFFYTTVDLLSCAS